MVNRVLLRMKVVQILYSFYNNGEGSDIKSALAELNVSTEKAYELYYQLLSLMVELKNFAADQLEVADRKKRISGDANFQGSDPAPIPAFACNRVLEQVESNLAYKDFLESRKITWKKSIDLVCALYKQVLDAKFYAQTSVSADRAYTDDRKFAVKLVDFLGQNQMLLDELERMSIYWNDDVDTVASFVAKTLRSYSESDDENRELQSKYAHAEDESFAEILIKKAVFNASEYVKMIDAKSKNWESERLAFMDKLIMQVALAEMFAFSQIPVNVTINEYVELSKYYSTEKSYHFINGVLDSIAKEQMATGKLTKMVSNKNN